MVLVRRTTPVSQTRMRERGMRCVLLRSRHNETFVENCATGLENTFLRALLKFEYQVVNLLPLGVNTVTKFKETVKKKN